MTEYNPTVTLQERMELLSEMNEHLRDTMQEWARRLMMNSGPFEGHSLRMVWMEDGTVRLDDDYNLPLMRVRVELSTSIVEPS